MYVNSDLTFPFQYIGVLKIYYLDPYVSGGPCWPVFARVAVNKFNKDFVKICFLQQQYCIGKDKWVDIVELIDAARHT